MGNKRVKGENKKGKIKRGGRYEKECVFFN